MYCAPGAAFGNAGVVIATGGATVIENWREAMCGGVPVSATSTTNGKVPTTVGVPEISPAALKFNPGGSDPPTSDQASALTGGIPPRAVSVAEYGCPLTAEGRAAVLMSSVMGGVVIPC